MHFFLFLEMPEPQRAQWNQKDENVLLDYLLEHKSEAGDGGNFKQAVFEAAAHLVEAI
jgi:hypothetical protein